MHYYLRTEDGRHTLDATGQMLLSEVAEPFLFFTPDDAYQYSQRLEWSDWDLRIDHIHAPALQTLDATLAQ